MTMKKLCAILKDKKGNAFPLIIAVTLSILLIFCGAYEAIRLMIIVQGVRDAVQSAVISTVNDGYDDVYHGVREGYSGAYQPSAEVLFLQSIPELPILLRYLPEIHSHCPD